MLLDHTTTKLYSFVIQMNMTSWKDKMTDVEIYIDFMELDIMTIWERPEITKLNSTLK